MALLDDFHRDQISKSRLNFSEFSHLLGFCKGRKRWLGEKAPMKLHRRIVCLRANVDHASALRPNKRPHSSQWGGEF
ncbi:hypothetical protein GN956_G3315 [Arapaima gigas]